MPGNTASEWHLSKTVDDIFHGNIEYNRVFHLLNELANLTTRDVVLTKNAASKVWWQISNTIDVSDVNSVVAVERNVVTLELEENSSHMSFSWASTLGRLSGNISVACDDWMMMNVAKCLIAASMLNASTSHGSHVTCSGFAMIPIDSRPSNLSWSSFRVLLSYWGRLPRCLWGQCGAYINESLDLSASPVIQGRFCVKHVIEIGVQFPSWTNLTSSWSSMLQGRWTSV